MMIVVAVCCSSAVWLSIRNVGLASELVRFELIVAQERHRQGSVRIRCQCLVQSGEGEQGIDKTIREQGNVSEWEGWQCSSVVL